MSTLSIIIMNAVLWLSVLVTIVGVCLWGIHHDRKLHNTHERRRALRTLGAVAQERRRYPKTRRAAPSRPGYRTAALRATATNSSAR